MLFVNFGHRIVAMYKVAARPLAAPVFKKFILKNMVLWIAILAAAITCIFVPFDEAYADYFDWRTVGCLFSTLLVVCAFRDIHVFEYIACAIVRHMGNTRNAVLALVMITYVASMILANDMALITFLPLGYFVLKSCGKEKHMAFTFVMQNVAANLGGMLTPFGNPQNLYLYSYYNIPTGQFFAIMAIPFAVALVMILATCMFVKREELTLVVPAAATPCIWRTIVYSLLFVLSICTVFRLFPYYWGVLAVFIAVLALDWHAVLKVDYALLLTFCAFFVFSGNMARIPAVQQLLSAAVAASPLLMGVACCQCISNVPSSVLLSKFTGDYANLLVAVNIGGLGTPIASLASLITLNQYRSLGDGHFGRYIALFSAINFSFLFVLMGTQLLIGLI